LIKNGKNPLITIIENENDSIDIYSFWSKNSKIYYNLMKSDNEIPNEIIFNPKELNLQKKIESDIQIPLFYNLTKIDDNLNVDFSSFIVNSFKTSKISFFLTIFKRNFKSDCFLSSKNISLLFF